MMFPRMVTRVSMAMVCLLSAGCLVGPNYVKPVLPAPDNFRGAGGPSPAALADAKWWDVFADEQLQALVRTATTKTTTSASRRRGSSRRKRSSGSRGLTSIRPSDWTSRQAVSGLRNSVPTEARTAGAAGVRVRAAWELDFWGRYRRANEAARARLLASEWGQRAVMSTLVSRVADAYFTLRALDLSLDVARRTLASRNESLDLARIREQGGATSMVDVRQAEQLVYSAAGDDRGLRTADRAAGELHFGPARRIPRVGRAGARTDRPAARTGSAGGTAVIAARATP